MIFIQKIDKMSINVLSVTDKKQVFLFIAYVIKRMA